MHEVSAGRHGLVLVLVLDSRSRPTCSHPPETTQESRWQMGKAERPVDMVDDGFRLSRPSFVGSAWPGALTPAIELSRLG